MHPANDNALAGASIRFAVEPRLVPLQKAARRLHLTASEFKGKEQLLGGAGFPAPCPVTGHYDLKAIDAWLDQQAGLSAPVSPALSDYAPLVARRLDALG